MHAYNAYTSVHNVYTLHAHIHHVQVYIVHLHTYLPCLFDACLHAHMHVCMPTCMVACMFACPHSKNKTNRACRHPHNNHKNFFQYLESCFGKLAKENKELYICDDFNYDLIKMDTDHTTQNFFNLLCSYGFLPHIIQPTRLTENTATCIDNIFSNNIQDEIVFGNILFTLSEHLFKTGIIHTIMFSIYLMTFM